MSEINFQPENHLAKACLHLLKMRSLDTAWLPRYDVSHQGIVYYFDTCGKRITLRDHGSSIHISSATWTNAEGSRKVNTGKHYHAQEVYPASAYLYRLLTEEATDAE